MKRSVSKGNPVTVAGKSDRIVIANKYRDYYASVYADSSACKESVDEYNDTIKTASNYTVEPIGIDITCIKRCKTL